jgi:hypothetical protein
MAIPATPTNFVLQAGDSSNFLSWDQMPGATSYVIQRSLDNVTFTTLTTVTGSPLANYYSDTAITTGTQYWYQVAAANVSGTSSYTASLNIIPSPIGQVTLQYLRQLAQERADRVNSQFVTLPEWNSYISESYKELYDLLIQKYGDDYYVANTYTWTTDGSSVLYPLPADFYKSLLVEVALNPSDNNSWITLRTFQRVQQNLWNYPNVYTFYGITNLRYRIDGNNLHIVPISTAGQTLRMWYAPRPARLVNDTQIVDGVSGWEEYIIVDAARKALAKEESDTSWLVAEKQALIARIESAAENRNAGDPERVSDSRMRNFAWSDDGSGWDIGQGW